MFRRLPGTLPPDPHFEPDLEKLGFFVTDDDLIRMIKDPSKKYNYRINVNERVNQVYLHANNAATRNIVNQRLSELGIITERVPHVPADEPHVPIHVSSNVSSASRIIVVFGERCADPGILSWRVVGEEGINKGSTVNFVSRVLQGPGEGKRVVNGSANEIAVEDPTSPATGGTALIIANPSQLLWSYAAGRAVSHQEWLGLPRESIVHEAARISEKNYIPRNRDYSEHIYTVFDESVAPRVKKGGDVRIDIVAMEYCATAVLEYLDQNWDEWSETVSSIALMTPQYKLDELLQSPSPPKPAFLDFLSRRARAYSVSDKPMETPLPGREVFGCNCYSSGEALSQGSVFARCWPGVLDWFTAVGMGVEEVERVVVEDDTPAVKGKGAMEW